MIRKEQFIIVFTVITALMLVGCSNKVLKEDKVYVAKDVMDEKNIKNIISQIDTEGYVSFIDQSAYEFRDSADNIPLTISPDKRYAFFMIPSVVKGKYNDYRVIKGDVLRNVSIVRLDRETSKTTIIINEIPFVTNVKWNLEGTAVGFNGGGKLVVYNTLEEKVVAKEDSVTYFGWSPDGKKIYTEHPNLSNGSILYLDAQNKVESYNTKENIYYKGLLDEKHFYATKNLMGNEGDITVVLNEDGTVIKELGSGRFRDSYKKAVLKVGTEKFGLKYIADINSSESPIELSNEFIYDAKFTADGSIAFITSNSDIEKNSFYLHIVNREGKEINKLEVSGSGMCLLPDGKSAYIGGELCEKVDFLSNRIQSSLVNNTSEEEEGLFAAIRGAMDICYKHEISGIKDYEGANKYFKNIDNPKQWAKLDIETKFNDNARYNTQGYQYRVNVFLKGYTFNSMKDRCEAFVNILAENSFGSGMGMDNELELVKADNRWYVSGFSTFSNSKTSKDVRQMIEEYIGQAKEGNLFGSELKGKDIEIGQIQFWQLSDPHLADNIETANYCKVYLKAKQNGVETLYKMVLDRKNQNYWKPTILDKNRLSYLF